MRGGDGRLRVSLVHGLRGVDGGRVACTQPAFEGGGESLPVERGDECGVIQLCCDVGDAAGAEGEEAEISGEGFGDGEAEGFLGGDVDEGVRGVEMCDEFGAAQYAEVARPTCALGGGEGGEEAATVVAFGMDAADEIKAEAQAAFVQAAGEFEEFELVFVNGEVSDVEQHRLGGSFGCGWLEKFRRERIWHAPGFAREWTHLFLGVCGVADDAGGFAERDGFEARGEPMK